MGCCMAVTEKELKIIDILLLRDAKLQPDCINQSANTRSPGMARNLNASRG